nr:DUF6716 putative glycosyltransferase [uncultured Cohaesibacter sp.]
MKIAIPFYDDSTLFFASKMKALLKDTEAHCITHYVVNGRHSGVSDRQMKIYLPDGPDYILDATTEISAKFYADYSAALFCRVPREYQPLLKNKAYMKSKDRPLFVAFQPGLEFTPEKGFKNRQEFDVIYMNSREQIKQFEKKRRSGQYFSWGHPFFMLPDTYNPSSKAAVYFFAQSVSPNSYNARLHVLETMRAIAIAHPERKVVIKLRHLSDENQHHVNVEEFSYTELSENLKDIPANLEFSACSMEAALSDAAYAITCTSTAAMDAICAGVPTMIYLDYVENYKDSMVESMQQLFDRSGLIAPLGSILRLEAKKPNNSWLQNHFRSVDFVEELVELFNKKSMIMST